MSDAVTHGKPTINLLLEY